METIEKTNELVKFVSESGLEQTTAEMLQQSFLPFFDKAKGWNEKARTLVVTDISQTREMKMAREARLALREIRINADKTRKALKEDSLRYGKAVQGVYNVIDYLITPTEKYLEEQEKFAEIQAEKKRAELRAQREELLRPYVEFVPYAVDLGNMTEDAWQKLIEGARLQMQAKIEADRKAEAERIERERKEAEERERVRLENERLKAEAIEKEKQLAELKAKAEAEERAKKETDAKSAAELKAKQEAEIKAKAAPDKSKLIEFANVIEKISLPELKSEEALKILADARGLLLKVSGFIREKTAIL
jgi:hypothetical protein